MTFNPLRRLKRFLRSPTTIVGELLFITLFSVLGACLPQAGRSSAAEVVRLRGHGPFLTTMVDALALDHVFTSFWFLGALAFATASLSIVVVEQARRLRAQWNLVPTEAHFRSAPFRREFMRPAQPETHTGVRIRRQGRLGLAGSPLFHIGLLCVILAGGIRALFGAEAVVDLYEGETLPATVEAWGAQWPGLLGEPFHLDAPLKLTAVERTRYPTGDLKNLHVKLAFQTPEGVRLRELGINEELPTRRGRLYMDATHGPAALVEWTQAAAPPLPMAILMERKETHAFGAYAQGPGTLKARLRAVEPAGDARPTAVEVRILQGPSTLAEGTLPPGASLPLPGGGLLRLEGLPYWVRIHANHDPALGLAYAGFALALLGAGLTYGVVSVDEWVSVTLEGDFERVVVALRPQRFAPLFQEHFERLVRQHGGPI